MVYKLCNWQTSDERVRLTDIPHVWGFFACPFSWSHTMHFSILFYIYTCIFICNLTINILTDEKNEKFSNISFCGKINIVYNLYPVLTEAPVIFKLKFVALCYGVQISRILRLLDSVLQGLQRCEEVSY